MTINYLRKYSTEIIDSVRNGATAEELGLTKKEYRYLVRYYIDKKYYRIKGLKATGKTGRHSWHSRPIGTERFDKDGYILVKIGYPRVEKRKHILEWEKHNGSIDSCKEAIMFLDGDRTNCNIDNLVKVERRYLGALNKIIGQCITKEQKLIAIKAIELYCEAKNAKARKSMSKNRPIKPIHDKIYELIKEGYSRREIEEKLNVKKCVIDYVKKRRKLMGYLVWNNNKLRSCE